MSALQFSSKIELTRLIPESDMKKNLPLLDSDALSDADKASYRSMFYRSTLTSDMVRETEALVKNSEVVSKFGVPSGTPMHFFLSQDQDHIAPGWIEAATTYLSSLAEGSYTILPTGHYVHHEKADLISLEVKRFFNQL